MAIIIRRGIRGGLMVADATTHSPILRIFINEIRYRTVALGFELPPHLQIVRQEIWDQCVAGKIPWRTRCEKCGGVNCLC